MISTCCQIQQSFCTRVYGQLRVKHQLTQAFSSFAASRFTGADNFSSVLPQVLCDQLQLRAFAAAVGAFQCDKIPFVHQNTTRISLKLPSAGPLTGRFKFFIFSQ